MAHGGVARDCQDACGLIPATTHRPREWPYEYGGTKNWNHGKTPVGRLVAKPKIGNHRPCLSATYTCASKRSQIVTAKPTDGDPRTTSDRRVVTPSK